MIEETGSQRTQLSARRGQGGCFVTGVACSHASHHGIHGNSAGLSYVEKTVPSWRRLRLRVLVLPRESTTQLRALREQPKPCFPWRRGSQCGRNRSP